MAHNIKKVNQCLRTLKTLIQAAPRNSQHTLYLLWDVAYYAYLAAKREKNVEAEMLAVASHLEKLVGDLRDCGVAISNEPFILNVISELHDRYDPPPVEIKYEPAAPTFRMGPAGAPRIKNGR